MKKKIEKEELTPQQQLEAIFAERTRRNQVANSERFKMIESHREEIEKEVNENVTKPSYKFLCVANVSMGNVECFNGTCVIHHNTKEIIDNGNREPFLLTLKNHFRNIKFNDDNLITSTIAEHLENEWYRLATSGYIFGCDIYSVDLEDSAHRVTAKISRTIENFYVAFADTAREAFENVIKETEKDTKDYIAALQGEEHLSVIEKDKEEIAVLLEKIAKIGGIE